jgi:5-methylcytosine-specific restriction enzyme A
MREKFREADRARGSAHARGYDRAWRRVRASLLAGEPLCRLCRQDGRVTVATEVHHEVRVKDNPSLRLDPTNLVPLCQRCHVRISLSEDASASRRMRAGGGG